MHKGNRARLPQLRALVVAVHAAWSGLALALPQDANVVNGQVAITQPAAGTLHINASNGAIINWRQFSIGAGETTRFIQPSAASAVLNRVVGSDPSQLLGQLQANGQVFLINPNGIVVGAGARIDTNSFLASTLDIADADFLAGKLRFFENGRAGGIQNAGVVTAMPGGRVVLIAPSIENSGIIHAPDGQILLAAGRKLEIASLDLDGIRFEIQAPTDSVLNLGQLLADNGAVQAFASTLRQAGVVRADRLAVDADGSIVLAARDALTLDAGSSTRADGHGTAHGGSIVLQSAEGTTRVAGSVSAQGAADAKGGDIRVLGERVALLSGAALDASGGAGGGQILVGGDYQGGNAAVQNAERVSVAEGAVLRADATVQGDGGRVIVWADENTRYQGALSARGAGAGGDGGFAEVSGKQNLEFAGTADLAAAQGASGTLLLDPLDIIISLTSGILPSVVDEFSDFKHNVVTISPATLAALRANVTLQAERDIYVKDELVLTTAGAGVTMLAGGVEHDAGGIHDNAGITTAGGAVSLKGLFIGGEGHIRTAGGTVSLEATDTLNYVGLVQSAGGSVTLQSLNGNVNSAQVDAGSGSITVTAGAGISGGSYTTTGGAAFTATAGSINVGDVKAARITLAAGSSINAEVDASERVDAAATDGYVQLSNGGAGLLQLGTVSSPDGIYLYSMTGMAMAAGGLLSTPYLYLALDGSTTAAGTVAAPLRIAALAGGSDPQVVLQGVEAPVHLAFAAGTTVGGLRLDGTVAGLGASTVTGGDNLTGLSLSAAGGVLNLSATATGGLAQGLDVYVRDGGLHAASLALPGARVDLDAEGAVAVDAMSGGSLQVTAKGAITLGSVQTTGNAGIYASVQQCTTFAFAACTAASPITAGTLGTTGGGDIGLYTYDNGGINVTSITASGDVQLQAGRVYSTSPSFPYTSQPTTNGIGVGSLNTTGSVYIANAGQGDVNISSLQAGNYVQLTAGSSYTPSANTTAYTANQISVQVAGTGAQGSFAIYDNGTGSIALGGVVDRTASGDISLSARDGSITASGNLLARYSVSVQADTGAVSLADVSSATESISIGAGTSVLAGQLQAGNSSSFGSVDIHAGTDLRFASIAATGFSSSYGSVTLDSTGGAISTTLDNTAWDITASGNVSLRTFDNSAGAIGNAAFANPLDIRAGASAVVTLAAGKDIGAAGRAVRVDTGGTIDVASAAGQFHVAATDGSAERAVASIRLAASAAGVGAAGSATFTSDNMDVTATSDGSTLTIGNLQQSTGTLNEFAFTATGSSLLFGDVNLASGGINKLVLASDGLLQQASGNILAGNLSLNAGSGDVVVGGSITSSSTVVASPARNNILAIRGTNITTGDLSAQAIDVQGTGNVALGAVTSTGTQRSFANSSFDFSASRYPLDELKLAAGGNLQTSGNVTSATSAFLSAGGTLQLGGGSGTATAGNFSSGNYADRLQLTAGTAPGGAIATGALSGRNITAQGYEMDLGTVSATDGATLTGTDIATGAISAGYITLTSQLFATGNLTAGSTLTINALAAYAPSGIALSANAVNIFADGNITLGAAQNTTVSAPQVRLSSTTGDVRAELLGTSSLSVDAGRGFDVTTDTWLSDVSVTAQWDQATQPGAAGASVASFTASGSQSFNYSFDNALELNISSALAAGRSWNLQYRDTSPNAVVAPTGPGPDDHVSPFLSHAGSGTFHVEFGSDTVIANLTANLGATSAGISTPANLTVISGGAVHFANVQTHGGYADAVSYNGDISVGLVNTSAEGFAGDVNLTAYAGNILRDGGGSHLIRTGADCSLCTLPTTSSYGGVLLYAPFGSVGGTGAIPLAYAQSLNVTAHDAIAVDASTGTLGALTVAAAGSGSGTISVLNGNFTGLAITRSAGNLQLSGLNPGTVADFGLTAIDGSIVVTSDITGVGALSLNAGNGYNSLGDLLVQASGAARTVSAQSLDLRAGRDILVTAGAGAGENVLVAATGTSGYAYAYAGRDLQVLAGGGTAQLSHAASGWTQYLQVGRDLRVAGGSAGVAGATATISGSNQQFTVGNDFLIQAGTADGASASVTATASQNAGSLKNLSVQGGGNNAQAALQAGSSQSFSNFTGNVLVTGGAGTDATARIEALASSQTIGSSNFSAPTLVRVEGGTGANAAAAIRASSTQSVYGNFDIQVVGGAAAGADAEIRSVNGSQNIGSTFIGFNSDGIATRDILVQGGAGGTARILAQTSQNVQAGGLITVLGGTGANTSARIEATTGSQSIGSSSTSSNDPTGDVLVQGGTGADAFAAIVANGSQTLNTGGNLTVQGGNGTAAYAEIRSATGNQNIGNTSTSFNDATGHITVRGGIGGLARIQAQGSQTLRMGGDFTVQGGSGANTTASVTAVNGAQTIGQTTGFATDSTGVMLVQGGSGAGAAAWVRAASNQTFNIGNTAMVAGGSGQGAFAELATTGNGFQTLNNNSGGDGTGRGVTLQGGGQQGSHARMRSNNGQQISTSGDLVLQGGTGDGTGALAEANTGQTVSVGGALRITGGSATTGQNINGLDNLVSGNQNIFVGGDIVLTAGGAGSDTGIVHLGSGSQYISSSNGSLSVLAGSSAGADAVVMIEAGTGGQTLDVRNGSIVVDNAGAASAHILSEGRMDIFTRSLSIALSSGATAAAAVVESAGDLSLSLAGDGSTAGSATLSVVNRSGAAGSLAALRSGGDLDIQMDYDTAGLVQIGAADALGRSMISADRQLTMVAGSLAMQGGAAAGADALLLSAQADPSDGIMVLSTIFGPVEMRGGAAGGAFIDPPELYIASNGSVLMQAGGNAPSNVNINAGLFDLAATAGDLSLVNSTTSPATATITSGSFNYYGSGGVNLTGGTITVTDSGSVTVPGICANCDTNLIGPFTVSAYVPPPIDYAAEVAADLLDLAEQGGIFEIDFDGNGGPALSRRRLNQCY